MTFEDELRATMRAHEDEAPHGLTMPARRRRGWLPALAAAAVVLLTVALSIALGRHGDPAPATRPGAPLSCPAHAGTGTSVPSTPDDIAPRDRLVPDRTPREVVVCSYVRKNGTGPVIASSTVLGGDLAAVRDTLTFVPEGIDAPCAADLRATDGDAFRIGITYRSGTVWVAAPGDHCSGSSNGRFVSRKNLGVFARAAAAAGRWLTNPIPVKERRPCDIVGAGRRGEDTGLVPDEPTGLTICGTTGRHSTVTRVRTDFTALVSALKATSTRSPYTGCRPDAVTRTSYTLRFRYARGPDVGVFYEVGCHPELTNLSVQGDDADGRVLAEVTRLVAAH